MPPGRTPPPVATPRARRWRRPQRPLGRPPLRRRGVPVRGPRDDRLGKAGGPVQHSRAREETQQGAAGAGPACPRASTVRFGWLLWRPVFLHCVGGGKRADALRRRSRARPCDLPLCRRGSLRIIAPIPQAAVSTRILRPLTLAAVPPPSAPARWRQELCACAALHDMVRGLGGDGRTAEVSLPPLRASRVQSSPLPSSAFPEPLAPGQPLRRYPHPSWRPVQTARSRARPGGAPLRRAGAGR